MSTHDTTAAGPIPRYAFFALAVLTGANLLNYLDRLIISILAQDIKADLQLDDAQLGFLMGTAFAIFYAVVGIAMGRISDSVSRTRLMAFGLALWSAMTALGGLAVNFLTLAVARIGIGVGEATATPSSHSLLSQYFPPRNRAMALAVYLGGIYVGGALAMILGGWMVEHWDSACRSVPIAGACNLPAWKATFIAVGLPGIPLALFVLALREPERPPVASERGTLRLVARELAAALPPFTFAAVREVGGGPALRANLLLALLLVLGAGALVWLTGDVAQWVAIAIGAYSVTTWAQVMKYRDRPLYRLTFGDRTFLSGTLGAGLVATIGGAAHAWAAPYAMRTFALSPADVGLSLGLLSASAALIGVLTGGFVTDRWKRRDLRAPIWVAMISVVAGLPGMVLMLFAPTATSFLGGFFVYSIIVSLWAGGFAALAQDLVLPRMRGAAASAFSLVGIVVASGAGPYWAGKVSALTGSLVTGLLSTQLLLPVAVAVLWYASRALPQQTPERRVALAGEAGEPA